MQLTKWVHGPIWMSKVKVIDFQFLNFFSWESARPIEAKFHVEPQWDGGMKVCPNDIGHMTKMATMPIYGKNMKSLSFLEQKGWWPWKFVCSIGCSSTTKFVQMMTLSSVPYAFVCEKFKTMDFSETIVVHDTKVGRCSQLNEYMRLCEYQRSRWLTDLCPSLSDSIFLNFFFSITTRLIEAKVHMEPPWDRGTKVCSNGPGHMTKMVAMPIYGKNH